MIPLNINKIKRIINCVEVGDPDENYDLTIEADGLNNAEQITVGIGLDEASGDILKLLTLYSTSSGIYSDFFVSYLPKLGVNKPSMYQDNNFVDTLKKCVGDPIYINCFSAIWNELYFQPGLDWFNNNGFTLNLSLLYIQDSYTQSGDIPMFLRNKFSAVPPIKGGNEKTWISQYSNVRLNWLENNDNEDVRISSYRIKGYQNLLNENNWDLTGNITINGCTVTD